MLKTSSVYIFLFIVFFAFLVRLPGCFSDFWLDEILSSVITGRAQSSVEIFTRFHSDNNHHLNTLVLYLIGDRQNWVVYRLHSLVCGVGVVILAWFIALRAGRVQAVVTSLLVAGSYLMIHFSSEARGYALVLFFSLASFLALRSFAERRDWPGAVVFWLFAFLGFLSHLTYFHFFAAGAVWMLFELLKACKSKGSPKRTSLRLGSPKSEAVVNFGRCFGVPIIFLGIFYVYIVRRLEIAGGPDYRLIDVLIKALSYTGGGAPAGLTAVVAALVTGAVFLSAVVWLWHKKDSQWIFYLTVIFLSPGLALAAMRPGVMFVRYFLVSIMFGLIASGCVLGDLWRRGRAARLLLIAVMALFFIGNGLNTAKFLRYGRGRYLEALQYIASLTPGRVITIGSDHDFRNGMVIEYYERYLPPDKEMVYVSRSRYPAQVPMWMLLHRIGDIGAVSPFIGDASGNFYSLSRVFPYYGLSGWHWLVYRRQERQTILGR